jgi:cycloeucalenol cycloisomerase
MTFVLGIPSRAMFASWLAPHPAKAAVERWWLLYTPVWGAVAGAVMLSGWAESWKDLECLIFGVVLAVGALVPMLRPHPSERAEPFLRRTSTKLCLSVVLFSFGLNYAQTPFFFDVLHMRYGFDVTWTIDRNPVFLYLVTVAYFATYAALAGVAFRVLAAKIRGPALGWVPWTLAPIAIAFTETALNANPWLESLFCYDDLGFVLWFGTLVYAFSFVVALPMWMAIDEHANALPIRSVFVFVSAALFADWLFLELVRHHVAPLVTTVVDDAVGLREYAGCLVPPR